jgi:hypothetical protein
VESHDASNADTERNRRSVDIEIKGKNKVFFGLATYKTPIKKTLVIMIFWVTRSFNLHTTGIGMRRIKTSMTTFAAAFPM